MTKVHVEDEHRLTQSGERAHETSETRGEGAAPFTDSPWFWAYVFGTAAVVALLLASPRYAQRQPQLERQFMARQHGGQAVTGSDGPVAPSTSERMIITLRPLYVLLGLLLCGAWIRFWYRRLH